MPSVDGRFLDDILLVVEVDSSRPGPGEENGAVERGPWRALERNSLCARVCTHRLRADLDLFSLFSSSPNSAPMDVGEGPSQSQSQPHHAPNSREEAIQLGNTVLLKIPSGDIRTIKLEGNAYASNLVRLLASDLSDCRYVGQLTSESSALSLRVSSLDNRSAWRTRL